ncbi:glycosyltransferase [Massilia sp. LXY-6]|uniref:glycosyltransferase n=1 Tax=Massilia sp. LXY-6 TaxID=3379823 RepID=UPI003EDECD16
MAALSCAILLAWLVLALLRGGFWRVRLPAPRSEPARWPPVVAVVPARDEAELLGAALGSLLTQDYPGAWHVIVVDDHSSDGTAAVAGATARRLGLERRLTVVRARPLPPGWAGKVWAQAEGMAVLAERFPGTVYVLLTDADIAHAPSMLRQLLARAEAEQRVLSSLMVRLRCDSKAERALVPAFVFFFAMLYPFDWVNQPGSRSAAAAGGCMLARLDALAAIGGLAAIRGALIDDCALAAALKRRGPIRLDLADSSRSLRAYGWRAFWNMIARSAYTQLRHSPWRLAATAAGMLLLYAAPPALLLLLGPGSPAGAMAGAAWLIMAAIYCPMLRYYGRPLLQAPALPLVALFYLGATLASAWRHLHGRGGQWKGRSQALKSN